VRRRRRLCRSALVRAILAGEFRRTNPVNRSMSGQKAPVRGYAYRNNKRNAGKEKLARTVKQNSLPTEGVNEKTKSLWRECALRAPYGWLTLSTAAPRKAAERRRPETAVHRASGASPRDASVQGVECLPL
jgi:hypothetical protein